MKAHCGSIQTGRRIGLRDPMLYGHFIEHFHRQIYDGVYDPGNPLSGPDGFREDVIAAMKKIKVPVLRWPGGCFVSTYHWKKAVGPHRVPVYDKTWRVEDPNTFGTDEYVALCRRIGCEPYICTNAGTGSMEEMSDWMEYCNLENEGEFAHWRIQNGHPAPYRVGYWSIGNENYGAWELGAKEPGEWGRLVLESAKLMRHVDPTAQLSAATITDLDWNLNLLKSCGKYLDLVSIHQYWNLMAERNEFATYEQSMTCTDDLDAEIRKVRGLLMAMGLEKKIKIAFDEWNLRGWHHPNVHTVKQGVRKEDYLLPRDRNDNNPDYTMADAVFSACFLNTLNRSCDIVKMACFAPIVNTRGCIFTYDKGLVLRSTYHVFDLYVNYMGEEVYETWMDGGDCMTVRKLNGQETRVPELDVLVTRRLADGMICIAAVNKHPSEARTVVLPDKTQGGSFRVITVNGDSTEAYNDVDCQQVTLKEGPWQAMNEERTVTLAPHAVNVIQIKAKA